MILYISDLIKKDIEFLDFDVLFNKSSLSRNDFELKFDSPIRVFGTAVYNGEIVNIKGSISTTLNLQCSRCLKDFSYKLFANFDENFSKKTTGDVYQIDNKSIDLTDMIVDIIILSIPIKPLCRDNCEGLCPMCGKDLNIEHCGCKDDEIDPRFAVLKNLFNGNQGGVKNGKSGKKTF